MKILRSILLGATLAATSLASFADKIDINVADAAALAALNGVGQSKAEAIVEYRKANGPFRTIEDLANVKGLGPATLDRNRDRLTVGTPPPAADAPTAN